MNIHPNREVFMKKNSKQARCGAVQRFFTGEDPGAICESLGRSRSLAVQVGGTAYPRRSGMV